MVYDGGVNRPVDSEGRTALYIACRDGRVGEVERLLAQPYIDVNQARTDNGATPLYIASQKRVTLKS